MDLAKLLLQETTLDHEPRGFSITTGIVTMNYNADHPGQVKVKMVYGEKDNTETNWLPVMQPYCGNGYGEYFIPEIDTEVVIGFVQGEINKGIVLGCLWNGKDKIPEKKSNKDNTIKSIRTKAGHEIIFDDTENEENIMIKTKGELSVLLEDKSKLITITDKDKKNYIKIDADKGEVLVQADKKLTLQTTQKATMILEGPDIKMNATNLEINTKGSIKMKGAVVNVEGNNIAMKGNPSLKAEAVALELKGTMTKIN